MRKNIYIISSVFLFVFLFQYGFAQNAYITNNSSKFVSVINTATNTTLDSIPVDGGSRAVAVSKNGERVYVSYEYTGHNTNSISVIDANKRSVITNVFLNETSAQTTAIDLSIDDKALYAPVKDSLLVVNTQTFAVDARIPVPGTQLSEAVVASPDGFRVYAGGSENIYYINAQNNTVSDSVLIPNSHFFQFAISPDSRTLYALDNYSGKLYIVDVDSKAYFPVRIGIVGQLGVAVSPDGSKIYVTDSYLDSVSVVSAATKTVIATAPVGNGPEGISVSADGNFLYVVLNDEDKVSVLDASTLAVVTNIPVGHFPAGLGKFISRGNILPVKLLSFVASLITQAVQLQWQTATETNTSYFNIQRSTDGIHFTTIAKMNAISNSNAKHTYTYNDNQAVSLNVKTIYYRLQTTDADGAASISKTVTVIIDIKKAAILLLPNPVKNSMVIKVSNYTGEAQLSIIDMTGKKVMQQQAILLTGDPVSINTSALIAGTYYVQVKGNQLLLQQKFIKE